MPRFRLGDFLFDAATGELVRGEEVVQLRPHASQVLTILTQSPGQLVPRKLLRNALWPAGGTDTNLGLNVCIRQIRVALGDDPDNPTYVQTLRGRGYRLIAEVAPADPAPEATVDSASGGGGRRARPFALVALLALLGILALKLRPEGTRIAVLPFRDTAAGDSLPSLGRFLSDQVITTLAENDPDRIAVLARTSSFGLADRGEGSLDVGAALDADYVLEGSVVEAGGLLTIAVQLLDVASGTYRWSQRIQADSLELGGVQGQIARGVLSALSIRSGGGSPATEPTDPRVRTELLRAAYLIDRQTTAGASGALRLLDTALTYDSLWAPTWVRRAEAHLLLDQIGAARADLARARSIDPAAHDLDFVEGRVALFGEADARRATRHLEQALEREPGSADVQRTYAQALAAVGRLKEASRLGRRALTLDPVSATVRGDIGWVFYYAREFGQARQSCRSALELVPASLPARACILLAAHAQGQLQAESAVIGEFLSMLGASSAESKPVLAALALGDERSLWTWLWSRAPSIPLDAVGQARVLMLLGREDDVVDALVRAVREDVRNLVLALHDPLFDRARTSEAFRTAAQSAGLPAGEGSRQYD